MTTNKNPNAKQEVVVWIIMLALIAALAWCTNKCAAQTRTTAQIDTMMCHNECIKDIIVTSTEPAKIFAVYMDERNDVSDLIPISKTVYAYIQECKKHGIEPHLGIRLRNGQITGIIRYKPKYVRR